TSCGKGNTAVSVPFPSNRQLGTAAAPAILTVGEEKLHELIAQVAAAVRHDLVELHLVIRRSATRRAGEGGQDDARECERVFPYHPDPVVPARRHLSEGRGEASPSLPRRQCSTRERTHEASRCSASQMFTKEKGQS